jgi:hypothetical protein
MHVIMIIKLMTECQSLMYIHIAAGHCLQHVIIINKVATSTWVSFTFKVLSNALLDVFQIPLLTSTLSFPFLDSHLPLIDGI